jgi:lipoprotein-releasing system permease protein
VKAGGVPVTAELFIAFRYLLGRAKEGGRYLRGAALGIALSLIPIVVTLIVADGMIRGITDRYIELGTGHLRLRRYFDSGESPGDAARNIPGVRGIWRERQGIGIVLGAKGKTGVAIRAVDGDFFAEPGSRRFLTVIDGAADLDVPGGVLLGEELAASAGAELGKTIHIMSLRRTASGAVLPRTIPLTVRGIVSSGYRELDALWCIISAEDGDRLLDASFADDFYTVKIDAPYTKAGETAWRLAELLGPAWEVYTWKELQFSQYRSYESTRQILLFIMAMVVLVAAVHVSSATSMLVIERRRDIAVLKAGGASPAATGRVFMFASFLTGLLGAGAGIAAGLLIGYFINPLIHGLEAALSFFSSLFHGGEVKILDPGYYLAEIPVVIDWRMVFLIGLFTVLCSVLASYLPARGAGKLKPMEILRRF